LGAPDSRGGEQIISSDLFFVDDEDRYARLRLIGWWDQEKLAKSRVIVVGAGALGNEVLKNLALVGVGRIHVVDFDQVQNSNLSRSVLFRATDNQRAKAEVAAEMVRELNPDCLILPIVGDVLSCLGLGLVRDADVVIGCVDNREARLWINRMCWKVGTPWIDGGIQEINGVAKVFSPPDGPCYECGMTERDYQLIQLRYSCPLLKIEDMQQGKVPTAPTIASIIGGLQAQEALKLIHGLPTDTGSALVFNGVANQFYKTKYPFRDSCLSHEFYGEPLVAPLSASSSTVSELLDWVSNHSGSPSEAIELDRDFLSRLQCRQCERQVEVNRPRHSVGMSQALCASCQQVMTPESVHEVYANQWGDRKLAEIGVPAYDIVKVRTNIRLEYVLLDADSQIFD
jgi:adenylyltransferase/sulfurtransferase